MTSMYRAPMSASLADIRDWLDHVEPSKKVHLDLAGLTFVIEQTGNPEPAPTAWKASCQNPSLEDPVGVPTRLGYFPTWTRVLAAVAAQASSHLR